MDEILNRSVPESSPADSRIWISRIVIAVILGEAIWRFVVSITNDLALPAMARIMGGDTQSPLYLGKGDFNVPALFSSVLELCFAGIMAVLLNSCSQKARHVRLKAVRRIPVEAPPASLVPPAVSPGTSSDTTVTTAPLTTMLSTPQQTPSPPIAKSVQPKPRKVVHYNIVGEPVDDDND